MPKPRVLVVDDNPSIRTLVAELLELAGYAVATAADGLEALRAVERARPALVILDMHMPGLDGWGFARELRARGLELPMLVVTSAPDARRWADEIGAVGCLPKPFEIVALISLVGRLCGAPPAAASPGRQGRLWRQRTVAAAPAATLVPRRS